MKILICYDGSDCADEAIEDLCRAGLPATADAMVLTVTETFTSPEEAHEAAFADTPGFSVAETFKIERAAALEKISRAEKFNAEATRKLERMFSGWTIEGKTTNGFPEYAIGDEAKKFKPDLTVVGSHGRGRRSAAREEFDYPPLRPAANFLRFGS